MGDEQLLLFNIPSNQPQTFRIPKQDPYWDEITREPKKDLLMVVEPEKLPSTTISKRLPGYGTGRITRRTISKNGKSYYQYWYDWQFYQNGKLIGRCKYISKRLLPQIQAMEAEKVPVNKILELLGIRCVND